MPIILLFVLLFTKNILPLHSNIIISEKTKHDEITNCSVDDGIGNSY